MEILHFIRVYIHTGTELYIQMQIDDLVDTISPFVIQKLRDLAAAEAEAEATQDVALAASSLKSGVSGLQISRQQSFSFSQGSSWSSATLPYLSPERPPSRGLSNSQLLLNTQRSRLGTARSGQMSRPTTQSKTQLELNEESVRSFVDRLVPILQSYFKYPVQITKVWMLSGDNHSVLLRFTSNTVLKKKKS